MANLPYGHSTATTAATYDADAYRYRGGTDHETARRSLGPQIFLWLGWAAIAFFWGATLTTGMGILNSIAAHPGYVEGGADIGGSMWLMAVLGGFVILGLAIAWGMIRYSSRDKSRDALTERATAALYDTVDSQGGEDLVSRSPEARAPLERDAHRASESDMR